MAHQPVRHPRRAHRYVQTPNPLPHPYPHPLHAPKLTSPSTQPTHPFLSRPLFTPLLFPNESSDARDHCANERTFLSWLRLSTYMAVVSAAIVMSFHLKSQPTSIEKKIAFPFGLLFCALSLACLANGFANYVKTVTKYGRRQALVQSGWKTQVVSVLVHGSGGRGAGAKGRRGRRWGLIVGAIGVYDRGDCHCCSLRFVPRYGCTLAETMKEDNRINVPVSKLSAEPNMLQGQSRQALTWV